MLGYNDISHQHSTAHNRRKFSVAMRIYVSFARHAAKSTGKMDIKVMLGADALVLPRDKNFLVFFFCSFLFAMPLPSTTSSLTAI